MSLENTIKAMVAEAIEEIRPELKAEARRVAKAEVEKSGGGGRSAAGGSAGRGGKAEGSA